jgi:hypothetical protein
LWGTTIPRDNYLAAAAGLDALAERCAFDDHLASELKKLAAGSRLKAADRVDGRNFDRASADANDELLLFGADGATLPPRLNVWPR